MRQPSKSTGGRPLRIGLTCFWDGTYQEVAAARGDFSVPKSRFLDYLYASSVLPVMGRMPRFASRDQKPDTHRVAQFGDASLRHVIPVASYFVVCSGSECSRAKPAHEPLQQLFVIATSPYVRGSDLLPVPHSNYGRADTELITDGRKIMRRAIALMADTPFRTDLDSMLLANRVARAQRFRIGTPGKNRVVVERDLCDSYSVSTRILQPRGAGQLRTFSPVSNRHSQTQRGNCGPRRSALFFTADDPRTVTCRVSRRK